MPFSFLLFHFLYIFFVVYSGDNLVANSFKSHLVNILFLSFFSLKYSQFLPYFIMSKIPVWIVLAILGHELFEWSFLSEHCVIDTELVFVIDLFLISFDNCCFFTGAKRNYIDHCISEFNIFLIPLQQKSIYPIVFLSSLLFFLIIGANIYKKNDAFCATY